MNVCQLPRLQVVLHTEQCTAPGDGCAWPRCLCTPEPPCSPAQAKRGCCMDNWQSRKHWSVCSNLQGTSALGRRSSCGGAGFACMPATVFLWRKVGLNRAQCSLLAVANFGSIVCVTLTRPMCCRTHRQHTDREECQAVVVRRATEEPGVCCAVCMTSAQPEAARQCCRAVVHLWQCLFGLQLRPSGGPAGPRAQQLLV